MCVGAVRMERFLPLNSFFIVVVVVAAATVLAAMQGPAGTPYEGGDFKLEVVISER
jgi:hypothetical protein